MLTPHPLALHAQLNMLHDARLLLSSHGAQLTNMAFMAPGAALIETYKCEVLPSASFVTIAKEAGLRYFEARPKGKKCKGFTMKGKNNNYSVDFDAVIKPVLEQV